MENCEFSRPKIFISGDSWGCGEWTDPIASDPENQTNSTVSHKGLEQYFIEDNYTVFNSSQGGSSNKFSTDRLAKNLQKYYSPGDIILWIQSDPIRDLRKNKQGHYDDNIFINLKNNNDNFNQLEKCLLTTSYNNLSTLADIHHTTIHVIGGIRNIEFTALSKFKNLNMLVKSWVYLLTGKHDDETIGCTMSDWTIHDCLIDQLPKNSKLKLINDLYKIEKLKQALARNKLFRPDGFHPNRDGHKHLYNFIKEKLNL